ncbi:C6 transcription factor [Colletotrichum chrysophilum]|uniref:C6 transcription factor n=1 Tax=Colletotrichum chrysophilum TaxID=1836956 RepID=A0AAD9AIW8_9PEZI|nr:C6 transcription factor [Colletotrichum chrysophilum]
MYDPAPARPKKTDITRTKTGCLQCRRKRRKCDEQRPACRRCSASSSSCEYEFGAFEFKDATQWAANKVRRLKMAGSSASTKDQAVGKLATRDRKRSNPIHPATFTVNQLDTADAVRQQTSTAPLPPTPPVLEFDEHNTSLVSGDRQEDINSAANYDIHGWRRDDSMDQLSPEFFLDAEQLLTLSMTDFIPVSPILPGDTQCLPWDLLMPSLLPSPTSPTSQRGEGSCSASTISSPDNPTPPDETLLASETSRHENQSPYCTANRTLRRGLLPASWTGLENQPELPSTRKPAPIPVEDRPYLAHFRLNVMNNLPVRLDNLWKMMLYNAPLRYAAMALAAASLANLHGHHSSDHSQWVLAPIHSSRALNYVSKCSEILETHPDMSWEARLTIMILATLYELETGTIVDLRRALAVLDNGIRNHRSQVLSLTTGKDLGRIWVHLRYLELVCRGPQHPLGIESANESLLVELVPSLVHPAQRIQVIGCQASRISQRLLFSKCFYERGDSAAETLSKVTQWWEILKGTSFGEPSDEQTEPDTVLPDDELFTELRNLQSTLAGCEAPEGILSALLPDSEAFYARPYAPLRLPTHQMAMTWADYAFAQLLCTESNVQRLTQEVRIAVDNKADAFDCAPMRSNPWLNLLLRITDELDPVECQKRNTYRIGIFSVLFQVSILGAGRIGFEALQQFIQRSMAVGVLYEGPFTPLHSARSCSQAILRYMAAKPGRAIFAASFTYSAWEAREVLFSKGGGQHVLLCGREADGRYLNDLIPVDA